MANHFISFKKFQKDRIWLIWPLKKAKWQPSYAHARLYSPLPSKLLYYKNAIFSLCVYTVYIYSPSFFLLLFVLALFALASALFSLGCCSFYDAAYAIQLSAMAPHCCVCSPASMRRRTTLVCSHLVPHRSVVMPYPTLPLLSISYGKKEEGHCCPSLLGSLIAFISQSTMFPVVQ